LFRPFFPKNYQTTKVWSPFYQENNTKLDSICKVKS
jgi:hypothetical protein